MTTVAVNDFCVIILINQRLPKNIPPLAVMSKSRVVGLQEFGLHFLPSLIPAHLSGHISSHRLG